MRGTGEWSNAVKINCKHALSQHVLKSGFKNLRHGHCTRRSITLEEEVATSFEESLSV